MKIKAKSTINNQQERYVLPPPILLRQEQGRLIPLKHAKCNEALKKGNQITNVNDGKKIKLARIVRMHSDDMEDISEAGSGS